jgi:hypothetical protein
VLPPASLGATPQETVTTDSFHNRDGRNVFLMTG